MNVARTKRPEFPECRAKLLFHVAWYQGTGFARHAKALEILDKYKLQLADYQRQLEGLR